MRIPEFHGFRIGLEVEFHREVPRSAFSIPAGWQLTTDGLGAYGDGFELRFDGPVNDAEELGRRLHSFTQWRQRHQDEVTVRAGRHCSPRGIHVHVSHPDRVLTDSVALFMRMQTVHKTRARSWRERASFTEISPQLRSHYTVINARTMQHIELRGFNGSLRHRALLHAVREALQLAELLFLPADTCTA